MAGLEISAAAGGRIARALYLLGPAAAPDSASLDDSPPKTTPPRPTARGGRPRWRP